MSSEPLTTTPDAAASADRGLLIAMLILVLLGTGAMLMM